MGMEVAKKLVSICTHILNCRKLLSRVHGKMLVAGVNICQEIHLPDVLLVSLSDTADQTTGLIWKAFLAVCKYLLVIRLCHVQHLTSYPPYIQALSRRMKRRFARRLRASQHVVKHSLMTCAHISALPLLESPASGSSL